MTAKDGKTVKSIFKSKLMDKLVTVLIAGLFASGAATWNYFHTNVKVGQEHKELEKHKALNMKLLNDKNSLEEILEVVMSNSFVSSFVENKKLEVQDKIVELINKDDSSRVALETFLGKQTGYRDEDILPLLAQILKAFKEGDIMTKEDAEGYIKREIEKRRISAKF